MAKLLKLRRGTTTQHSSFTGAEGEVTIDTTKDTVVVHDGSQAGGRPLAREDMSNVSSIAGTKISPDFGSQNITTTGTFTSSNATISSTGPSLTFNDTNNESDFQIVNNNGNFQIRDIDESNRLGFQMGSDGNTLLGGNVSVGGKLFITEKIAQHTGDSDTFITFPSDNNFAVQTGGTTRFQVSDHVDVIGNLDVSAGLDVTGNITCTGTIPAAQLTGTLPALDGSNLTGIAGIPSGVIAIWSGATSAIPSGWVICDGNNSTPDLRDKFIIGAGNSYAVNNTGGDSSKTTQVSVNGNTGWASQYANASSMPNASPEPFNSRDRHQHSWGGTFTTSSFSIIPPYYALAFIMKS